MKSWWRKIIQQDFGGMLSAFSDSQPTENTYHLLDPSWYSGISSVLICVLISIGITIIYYSQFPQCIMHSYTCGDREAASFQLNVDQSFANPDASVNLYYGLSGFYSTYIGVRMSYSSVQIQATPRSPEYIPYSGCSPISKLSDVSGATDVLLPIDYFATDPDWKRNFNMTEIWNKTLRPCGALYYWIPTDTIAIFDSSGEELRMETTDLSWDSLNIPSEPANQTYPFIDNVTGELVWADPSTNRMRAWTRSNIHSNFMVKAGTLTKPLPPGVYNITITQCRDLQSDKFIKLCTSSWFGYDQTFLGAVYFFVAGVLLIAVIAYFVIKPNQESIALFN